MVIYGCGYIEIEYLHFSFNPRQTNYRLRGDMNEEEEEEHNDTMGSDMSDDGDLLNQEDKDDLEELDRMNSTFVAAALERQHEQGFCDASSTQPGEGVHTDLRPFEDELGELLLEQFQNQYSSGNNQPADQAPAERSKVGIQMIMLFASHLK